MSDSTLCCPRDGSPLSTRRYEENIEVDECRACHGMWLDKGELEAIQRSSEHDYRHQLTQADDAVAPSIRAGTDNTPINCPKCGAEMENREYAYCSQVYVDTCVEGCGVWLDKGEIEALEVFFEKSQRDAPDTIPLRWRLWASLHGLFGKDK